MKTRRFISAARQTWALGLLALAAALAHASDIILPPGAYPCEADWIGRQPHNTLKTVEILKLIEREAERGQVSAQYRLGMVVKTMDGKWTAPKDHSYNIKWLEAAIKNGSKSAAAHLAEIKWSQIQPPAIGYEAYMKAQISAATEERNPWIASQLMDRARGRWGAYKGCDAADERAGYCSPLEPVMLPKADTRRWAEISAEGGNPVAQELLCVASADGRADLGQVQNDDAAYKWCLIASHNACSLTASGRLPSLLREGRGTKPRDGDAQYWRDVGQQPWRKNGNLFFQ